MTLKRLQRHDNPGSSQFNLPVLSLYLTERPKLCGSLQVWKRVNQPFYMIYEVNRTIRSCLFIVQTSVGIHVIFFPILIIILQFFEYSYKTNCTYSIFRTIEASASRPSITTRSLTRTSTRNLTRSPTRSPTRTRIQIIQ